MEKEVTEAERRLSLRKIYSERIDHMMDVQVEEKELYLLIRRFFAEFLKLEYEFTYEELSIELNKIFIKPAVKQQVDKLLSDLSMMEYMPDHALTHDEQKKILGDFKQTISLLIMVHGDEGSKLSFFEKLLGKKEPETQQIPQATEQELPQFELPVMESKEEPKEDILPQAPIEIPSISDENVLLFGGSKSQEKQEAVPPKIQKDEFVRIEPYQLHTEDNDPNMVRLKYNIEKSYLAINAQDYHTAKNYYMDAIESYNKLSYDQKTSVYIELYDLFCVLSKK